MDAAIEARLLEMLDRQDILDCIHRYTRGMDRFDKELLLSAYHPDAIDDHGAFVGSPEGFWDFYSDWHSKYNRSHHHTVTNHNVVFDGTTAHAETYWLFQSENTDDSITISGGRYIDRFEKRNGEWKIAARACLIEWGGNLVNVETDPEFKAMSDAVGISSRDRRDLSYQRPLQITRQPTPAAAS